ncbi:S24 family peptidase [Sandaracinobacter neustonicus]|uniref:S24 family peptidase n=1 Tax=Sandaracinobacter neustonicus TaxID=1715348 RepID=A0A501XT63_9SPHN|nr:S24 family peptidase [Sandaracinobacter neustonicus]TPE63972.1 S24 family peptidase [Sandaracinobacter neustonicus]
MPEGDEGHRREIAAREQLDTLIRNSGQGYAEISRLIGRNPAYIQQFIKRGVPRRLGEDERRLLARHFGVSEALLGGPADAQTLQPDSVSHRLMEISYLGEPTGPRLRFDSSLIERLPPARRIRLAAHLVEGDSMAPTLLSGDTLLIDRTDCSQPRDGLYLIESDSLPTAHRLSVHPVTRRVAILSDNSAYPSFPDCDPEGIRIVGRIVWLSRPLL